jgi:ABC-type Fe3+/spermidine/putrescine transport system ATPase subunit
VNPPEGEPPLLRVRGLRKSYGGAVVLHDLDLDIGAHQVLVLIGASGSGKSTLLRCIDLLERVDDGTIELEGRDLADPRIDADAARARADPPVPPADHRGRPAVIRCTRPPLGPQGHHGKSCYQLAV